jgi:hypothetical protein
MYVEMDMDMDMDTDMDTDKDTGMDTQTRHGARLVNRWRLFEFFSITTASGGCCFCLGIHIIYCVECLYICRTHKQVFA